MNDNIIDPTKEKYLFVNDLGFYRKNKQYRVLSKLIKDTKPYAQKYIIFNTASDKIMSIVELHDIDWADKEHTRPSRIHYKPQNEENHSLVIICIT